MNGNRKLCVFFFVGGGGSKHKSNTKQTQIHFQQTNKNKKMLNRKFEFSKCKFKVLGKRAIKCEKQKKKKKNGAHKSACFSSAYIDKQLSESE